MVKSAAKKYFLTDVLKSALISVLLGAILILVFATVLNFVPIGDKLVTVINQIIKVLAVFAGCFFGIKEKKNGILKGLLAGLLYSVGTILIFAIINKSFDFSWGVALDVGLGAAIGAICGIISVNLGKKSV